ncbi:hypothetical protein [Solirubrum puertoriconensis]|uniref:Uncharacterized protein n=1 Tax=Solirubrum puertoriconensis TaxID=1751427 RepID=A0A9X0HLB8_SOLP1|nr:hypothetical protein [Solirubrum puertoriconensis]KUG08006.1 hypothetical protein ASU33_07295 [Solirubrum puertoriconensis]
MAAVPTPDLTLYDPFVRMQLVAPNCFLCGTPVDPAVDKVPVFAPWLRERYQLGSKPIQMLDQSTSSFDELSIPCCAKCHHEHVNALEARVEQATAESPQGLRTLDEQTLFLWLGKMFYGIFVNELARELEPLIKPRYPLAENRTLFSRFRCFFQVLQALRVPMEYDDFTPGSVFLLDVNLGPDDAPFAYDDDLATMVFSIRLGNVAVVSCVLDNAMLRDVMERVYADAQTRPLHPVQLAEFKARVYYGAYLISAIPEYFPRPVKPGDEVLVMDTFLDDVTGSVFNPWDTMAYAQTLEELWLPWQISLRDILRDPRQPLSYLYDEAGNPRVLTQFPE